MHRDHDHKHHWIVCLLAGTLFAGAIAPSYGAVLNLEGSFDYLNGRLLKAEAHMLEQGFPGGMSNRLSRTEVSRSAASPYVSLQPADISVFEDSRFLDMPVSPRRHGAVISLLAVFLLAASVVSLLARTYYTGLKRVIDIVGSIVALSLLLPVVAVAAIIIKIDSPGPVFIRQVRVGLDRRRRNLRTDGKDRRSSVNHGSLFTIYKLRTMRADAEASTGPVWARKNDRRITRSGKFLRKTRIDEIPQFINVLKGEMCIIGPRPERPVFIHQLNNFINNYTARLKVKPGITGLAQVRFAYTSSIEDTRIKLRYDLLYVKKMCLSMDLRILLNTFNTVVMAKGAR